MTTNSLAHDLELGLAEMPILDIHTHLTAAVTARGLDDILLYHMVISDLYGAGCPSGERLTDYRGARPAETEQRIEEALPYLPHIRNTSMAWGLRLILRDLYGWDAPITAETGGAWTDDPRAGRRPGLGELDPGRHAHPRTSAELARRDQGRADDRLQYSLEWGCFTRNQPGEFDTALVELEQCWIKNTAGAPAVGSSPRAPAEAMIRTLDDVHAASQYYVDAFPMGGSVSMATHLSTDIDYRPSATPRWRRPWRGGRRQARPSAARTPPMCTRRF